MTTHIDMHPLPQLARQGDAIEVTVRHPVPGVIKMELLTPESCAAGNDLLMNKGSGWRLSTAKQVFA